MERRKAGSGLQRTAQILDNAVDGRAQPFRCPPAFAATTAHQKAALCAPAPLFFRKIHSHAGLRHAGSCGSARLSILLDVPQAGRGEGAHRHEAGPARPPSRRRAAAILAVCMHGMLKAWRGGCKCLQCLQSRLACAAAQRACGMLGAGLATSPAAPQWLHECVACAVAHVLARAARPCARAHLSRRTPHGSMAPLSQHA